MDNPTLNPIIQPPGAVVLSEGATLRDYFAAKAMQAFMTRGSTETALTTAMAAYEIADAMLAAR